MAYRVAVFPLEATTRPDQAPVGLESLIDTVPGVRDVAIDPIGMHVRMVYDDEQVDIHEVTRMLAEHGYPIGTPVTTEGEL